MRQVNWDRIAAASGFAFVAALVIGYVLPGTYPSAGDPADKIASFFLVNRTEVLVGGMFLGLAVVFFIWFLGSLGSALREAGEQRLAAVAFGGGLVGVVLAIVPAAIGSAVAFRIAQDVDPAVTRGLYELELVLFVFASFPTAALAGAAAIASLRARIFPAWYGALGLPAAVVIGFGGVSVARDGFFSADGGWSIVTFIVFLVWTVVTSGLLVRRAGKGAPA